MQGILNDVIVHTKIVVDELVTQSSVALPIHKRVLNSEFIRKVFDGFANDLEAAGKGSDKHFIMDERLEVEVLRLRGEEVYLHLDMSQKLNQRTRHSLLL